MTNEERDILIDQLTRGVLNFEGKLALLKDFQERAREAMVDYGKFNSDLHEAQIAANKRLRLLNRKLKRQEERWAEQARRKLAPTTAEPQPRQETRKHDRNCG